MKEKCKLEIKIIQHIQEEDLEASTLRHIPILDGQKGSGTKKNQSSLRRKKTQAALRISTANSEGMPRTSARKESETEEFLTQPICHLG